MDTEAVINLFDSCWFSFEILKNHCKNTSPPSNPNSGTHQEHQNHETSPEPDVSDALAIQTRSTSDHQLMNFRHNSGFSLSPDSVLFAPHLEPIRSGRTLQQLKKNQSRRRKPKKGSSKSLSELEFEELKGFMDLGFVFSEEDRYSRLVEIIPGLQRLGNKEENADESPSVSRPYLSEAWGDADKAKVENPLMKWSIPEMSNENDIKDSLKWWAHTVASTVG